jgi:hypothetical protein
LIRNLDLCGAVNGAARHAMDVWQREDAAVRGAVGHLETVADANVGDAIEKLAKLSETSSDAADATAAAAVKSALEAQALVIRALLADREERSRAMHYLGETAEVVAGVAVERLRRSEVHVRSAKRATDRFREQMSGLFDAATRWR